jgi:hypothetical protein
LVTDAGVLTRMTKRWCKIQTFVLNMQFSGYDTEINSFRWAVGGCVLRESLILPDTLRVSQIAK